MTKTKQTKRRLHPTRVKVFEDQPECTQEDLDRMTRKGFLVTEETAARGTVPGEVVPHRELTQLLKCNRVTEADAKRLVAVELTRAKWPRQSHIDRLVQYVFAGVRGRIDTKVAGCLQKRK